MVNDGGSGYSFWQLRVADPVKGLQMSGNNGRGGLGLPGIKERLVEVSSPCAILKDTIERIPESQIFERSIVARTPLTSWLSHHDGRLALVGDSAHGMHPCIGQGANCAFESAAVIVDTLSKVYDATKATKASDWNTALQEYQKKRMVRSNLIQQYANCIGVLQATGEDFFSKSEKEMMQDWILRHDPKEEPPKSIVETLDSFDIFQQSGVSPLW